MKILNIQEGMLNIEVLKKKNRLNKEAV